jgi:putative spermidine/putrescine transport system ATP-binding protein
LTGHVAHHARVGDRVRVAIRPHDLVVSPERASGQNSIEAVVSVVEYQGREFAVEVTTDAGANLFVHAETAPRPGDRVTLVADPARVLVYQADLDAESADALEAELAEVRA